MDTAFRGEPSFTVLAERVTLREFVTVHRASGEGNETRIGADTLVMSSAHVSHNVQVGQGCVLTTQVQLGGTRSGRRLRGTGRSGDGTPALPYRNPRDVRRGGRGQPGRAAL